MTSNPGSRGDRDATHPPAASDPHGHRPVLLGEIVDLIGAGTISGKIAKDVFEIVWNEGGNPREIVEKRGLKQVTDMGAIEKAVDAIIAANPDKVAQVKEKPSMLGWFVGQVMKATRGQVNAASVQAAVRERLDVERAEEG